MLKNTSQRRFYSVGKLAYLQKVCAHAQQQPHTQNTDHRRQTPDKVVYDLIDPRDNFDHTPTSLNGIF